MGEGRGEGYTTSVFVHFGIIASMDDTQADKSDWHAEGWTIAALACLAIGFGVIAVTMFVVPTATDRALTGDWLGGIFGACAGLASAFLFFGALKLQRSELRETRVEMKLARDVHDATRRELEAQTRIARRSAHLEHVFSAAAAMRALAQPRLAKPRMKDGSESRVYEKPDPQFIAAQMHLGMLLNDDLIESHERDLLVEQFGLNIPYERQPGNITPPIAEILDIGDESP